MNLTRLIFRTRVLSNLNGVYSGQLVWRRYRWLKILGWVDWRGVCPAEDFLFLVSFHRLCGLCFVVGEVGMVVVGFTNLLYWSYLTSHLLQYHSCDLLLWTEELTCSLFVLNIMTLYTELLTKNDTFTESYF